MLAFFVISFGKFGGGRLERSCLVPVCPAVSNTHPLLDCSKQLESSGILSVRQTTLSARALRTASTNHASGVFLSRNLLATEPFSGPKLAKLNRQTQEVEHVVTYRKQRATNCSNSQNIQKCPLDISPISQVAE